MLANTTRALLLLLAFGSAHGQATLGQLDDNDDNGWNRSAVLRIPPVITAGDETVWHMNVSNTPVSRFNHRKMEIYLRAYIPQDTADYSAYGTPDLYCFIAPCVTTSLTAIPITIPADSFPSSVVMVAIFSLYDSPDVGFTTWGDDSTTFNLTSGSATISEWESKYGWDALADKADTLPCDKVPCARSCIEKYLDANDGPYKPGSSDFDNCVDDCGLVARGEDDSECITENADGEDDATTSSTTSGTAPETTFETTTTTTSEIRSETTSNSPSETVTQTTSEKLTETASETNPAVPATTTDENEDAALSKVFISLEAKKLLVGTLSLAVLVVLL